jgi:hypothetical protein
VEPGVVDTQLYQLAAALVSGYDRALGPYRAVWPGGLGFPISCCGAAVSVDGVAVTLARAALAPARANDEDADAKGTRG